MLDKVRRVLSGESLPAVESLAKNATMANLGLAPSAPPLPGMTEVTGIYEDGKGTYSPTDAVEFAANGDLRITPLCSSNRSLNVLLPAEAIARLTGPMEPCRGNACLLKIPALLNAKTGLVGEASLPPDYPKGASVFYFFVVDTTGAGKFSLPADDAYYLVWQSGIHLTRTDEIDRTVYDLTTDVISSDAELIRETDTGGVGEGVFPVPLRLTVTNLTRCDHPPEARKEVT